MKAQQRWRTRAFKYPCDFTYSPVPPLAMMLRQCQVDAAHMRHMGTPGSNSQGLERVIWSKTYDGISVVTLIYTKT